MARLQMDIFTEALRRPAHVNLILPGDWMPQGAKDTPYYQRPTKTLILLHGYTSDGSEWILNGNAEQLAHKYNLAIVAPNGENSFYLDGEGIGQAYGRLIGQELIDYLRKTFHLAEKREDTFIGGLSMGGFGALHTGLQYPENFSKVIALSSALIIYNIAGMKESDPNPVANYHYYRSVFGDLDKVEESDNNPEVLARKGKAEGKTLPDLFMACGTEDFLLQENRRFRNFLTAEGIPVDYREGPGQHDWTFWNTYFEPGIRWALGEQENA
jgi:S-formylglutathione hydrolase FrmB